MITIPANWLARDSRVIISSDEMPYLVDTVTDTPAGGVRVVYSSGDIVEYAADEEVAIVG
ncbi:hypothetical protein ABZ605_37220 [Streptomyces sp. NPDC012765]|uniref:hypothetical protein n=1 Tax=Streptomyces sp. NPDC012765 TaxID=3155249 RepID=UPI0033E2D138